MTDLDVTAQQIHAVLRSNPASSPRARALHARGVMAVGRFEPSSALASKTIAAHLVSEPTDVVVRFSNGNGNPDNPDHVRDGRGLAVKFTGRGHDLVSVTAPVFPVRDGAGFLELLDARRPDPETGAPDPARIGAFLEAHPEAVPAVTYAITAPVPVSYATCRYNGLHTFFFVDQNGNRHPFRYQFEPVAGEQAIDDADFAGLDDRYLSTELAERLGAGPAAFDLVIDLGEPGDATSDPTAIWPERPELVAGRLTIDDVAQESDPVIFDPTNAPAGVELGDDEILALRRLVYGLSYAVRAG
jgi:catalase